MRTLIAAVVVAGAIALLFLLYWRATRRAGMPCPAWLSWLVELDNPFFRNNRADVIIDYLQLEPGMHVLDAGCGPGRLTAKMARKVGAAGSVTAVDIQEAMLAKVKDKAHREGVTNVRYIHAALGAGHVPLEHFDRAVLVTVLGEIPSPHEALLELRDALKPGGILAITEVIADPHFQGQQRVRALTRAVGLRELRTIGTRVSYTIYFEK